MGLGLSLAKGNLWIYLVSVQTVNSLSSMSSLSYLLRGGVTKKNGKIWGKFPIRLDPPPSDNSELFEFQKFLKTSAPFFFVGGGGQM